MKPTAHSRAVAYLRVSTEQQADSGLGLDAQRDAVTAAAARMRLHLANVFVDAGTSGGLAIEDRPVLLEAVASLRRGDVLLVAKRDRLGRDVIAVAMIERLIAKRGARMASAAGEGTDSDDPSGMLMRRLIDSFAEYERLMISARTRVALAAKRRRGERFSGHAPFGFTFDGGRLRPNASEQAAVAMLRRLHAAGTPLRRIATALNAAGHRTRTGSEWRFQYVRRVLLQEPIGVPAEAAA